MKNILIICFTSFVLFTFLSFDRTPSPINPSLTVKVEGLRNSKGLVQYALYDHEGSLPDQKFKKYHQIRTSTISDGKSSTTFSDLTPGTYAISVLHDENKDGKIEMGLLLPKEGIGFSNFKTIGLSNRPNFVKASFVLAKDSVIVVNMVYK
ncbi:DUF2141 domain-containing protein [Flagellimonas sp.]|uniref:DUF2141 domain-containing protein n=1 Tax=Flagellimonas sp. TaxID=2058762 RepID=UPI003BAAF2AC